MKCTYCGAEMMLKQGHCPQCGQKAVFDFDVLAQSVHEDAARRRGEQIENWLKWFVLLLMAAGAFLYGFNSLFDRPLSYAGGAVPALQAEGTVPAASLAGAPEPYKEIRPNPPLPQPVLRVFGYRKEPIRSRLRAQNGGNKREGSQKAVSTAIADGLRLLAQMQRKDGSWEIELRPDYWGNGQTKNFHWLKVGVSSLALLAYFGDGETWLADEKSGARGLYADHLRRGVAWLLAQQDAASGRFGPGADNTDRSMFNHLLYNHGLAALAMCEAAGLSGDTTLRASAQKGIDFILKTQTGDGGWNFMGDPNGDSEVPLSAWNVQALYAAREAGLRVPPEAFTRALEFYRKSTLLEKDGPRVSWSIKNDDKVPRQSLLAIAFMIRQLLGDDAHAKDMRLIAAKLLDNPPNTVKEWGIGWSPKTARGESETQARAQYDPFIGYFAAYGFFFRDGRDWDAYNGLMRKSVTEMQDSDGCWRCNDIFTYQAGFVYSTALGVLTLQAYYRLQ